MITYLPAAIQTPGSAFLHAVHPLIYEHAPAPDLPPCLNDLPEPARSLAAKQLAKIGDMVTRIAERLGVTPPLLCLPPLPQCDRFCLESGLTRTHIDVGIAPPPLVITLGTRAVEGLGALGFCGQAPTDLCLNDEELYAILAHEMGHYARRHFEQLNASPKVQDKQEQAKLTTLRFHFVEDDANAAAIDAGATRKGFVGYRLKKLRDIRQEIYHEGLPSDVKAIYPNAVRERSRDERLKYRTSTTDDTSRLDNETHPSLYRINAAMQTYETAPQTWREQMEQRRQEAQLAPAPTR